MCSDVTVEIVGGRVGDGGDVELRKLVDGGTELGI